MPTQVTFENAPIYVLTVDRDFEYDSRQAIGFVNGLLALEHVAMQIAATHNGIEWRVIDLSGATTTTAIAPQLYWDVQIKRYYRDFLVNQHTPEEHQYPFYRNIMYLLPHKIPGIPIAYATDFKAGNDPLRGLLNLASMLGQNERITYSVVVHRRHKPTSMLLRGFVVQAFSRDQLGDYSFSSQEEKIMRAKQAQEWYETHLEIMVDSPDWERVVALSTAIQGFATAFDRQSPYNGLAAIGIESILIETLDLDCGFNTLPMYAGTFYIQEVQERWKGSWLYFELAELASLWHLPHKGFEGTAVRWKKSVAELPRPLIQNQQGFTLGEGMYLGNRVKACMLNEDRITHCMITGKTRVGKSTLIHHLVHQDIAAGKGVAVIDPHGTLISAILQSSIPTGREADVVVLDLANPAYPPPLNPLRGLKSPVSLARVGHVIESLFSGTDQLPRVSKYLNAALGALQVDAQPTMRDLSRVFTDATYRNQLLEKLDEFEHAQVFDTWEHYDELTAAMQLQIQEPISSRISPFYQKPALYGVLCHPDGIDFHALMSQKKIVLISLKMDGEQVSEQEQELVGALLISLIQMSGLERATETFCYLYIDEVQKFVTSSLSVMLSEAAKFGLSLTVANQFLGQLAGTTLQALMGNVGTAIAFRCGHEDAKDLAPYFKSEFSADDLINFDRFEAAVKLQYRGQTQPAFTLYPLPPLEIPSDGVARERHIRELSIQRYTPKNIDEVKNWLKTRYTRKKIAQVQNEDETFYEQKPD